MLRWYYKKRIGYIYIYQYGRTYVGNIFGGNVLCVFTRFFKDDKTGKTMEQLDSFFVDEKHIKNCIKDNIDICPYSNTKSVRLNFYYKEAMVLAKYFTMQGVKVIGYYKKPKD